MMSLNYGEISSMALDPVEKKPLKHFFPGHTILSVGTWGCNFSCQFCQNWQLAQGNPSVSQLDPVHLSEIATQHGTDCIGVAYTYSEPTVWFEYVMDSAIAVRKRRLKNVLVTNGFINQAPLIELLPFIDAMNIDVKSFTEDFYRDICAGGLEAVKRTVETAVRQCHVEISTLLIPGQNDGTGEIESLARWLGTLDTGIPLHLSRYFPRYRMKLPPTPIDTLLRAQETASRYLKNVYLGNVEI